MSTDIDLLKQNIEEISDEILNAKLGYDGVRYATVGSSVRSIGRVANAAYKSATLNSKLVDTVVNDVNFLKDNLDDFVNVDAVDGLLYKNNTLFLTKGGQIASEGVTILSGTGDGTGSGLTSSVTISVADSDRTFSVASGKPAIIRFSVHSDDDNGNCTCRVIKDEVTRYTQSVEQNKDIEIDVSKYLSNGVNEITIRCSDIYNNYKLATFTITVVKLELTSTFNDEKPISEDSFIFSYTQVGDANKTVHFILGEGTNRITSEVNLTSKSNKNQQHNISASLPHGAHKFEVYMTADLGEKPVESNHLIYDLILTDPGTTTPIIASYYGVKEVLQGESITIPYIVYDPYYSTSDITLSICNSSGDVIYSKPLSVSSSKQFWNINNVPTGELTFTISYTDRYGDVWKKSHVIKVLENDSLKDAYETGLELYLSSNGRSNSDKDRDKWSYNDVDTSFSGFNWRTNGWVQDDNGDTCLRLNGNARAEILFRPFASDVTEQLGKTFEIEFAIRDVNDRSAIAVNCFDGTKGIKITPDKATFSSGAREVSCNYKDNSKLRIGFTVETRDSSSNKFMSIYLNGVLSGITQYTDDIFNQANPLTIQIGSDKCSIDIYTIRSYTQCLTSEDMINNYIADMSNIDERLKLYDDNDIYEDGVISYKRTKKKIPTVTFLGKLPTYKGDKKKNSVRMIFEHPTMPELNFDEILDQIDVQGTSSSGYVRKNWKIKKKTAYSHMKGELPAKVFCLKVDYAEGTGTHNTQNANLVETFYSSEIPPKVIPDDIDLTGNNLNTVDKINKVRTTITGYPIVIFHYDTSDIDEITGLTINDLESGEYNVKFSSKGNFNFDKDAEDVFAFNEDYDTECWEFLKNESPQSFVTPWPELPLDYWEPRYHIFGSSLEDKLDAVGDILDATKKAEEYEKVNEYANDIIFKRFKKMYDWVHSTARGTYTVKDDDGNVLGEYPHATNEPLSNCKSGIPVYETDESTGELTVDENGNNIQVGVVVNGNTHYFDTDEFRLDKFIEEFEDHFDLHYSAVYYVYTLFALMVDQRAKNLFLTYWKDDPYNTRSAYNSDTMSYDPSVDEEDPGKWYPYFYDNDTCYGISNKGHLDFDYYHEDTDKVGTGDVYNGQDSVLWNNFRDGFPGVVKNTYAELRNSGKLTYNKIVDQFINKGSSVWSASIYNQDADYKYVSIATPQSDWDSDGDGNPNITSDYLYQVRGNGEHHLEYFVQNRIKYCDSKFQCSDYLNNRATIQVYTPTKVLEPKTEEDIALNRTIDVVKPNSILSIVPFSRMYYSVQYGAASGSDTTKSMITKRATNTTDELLFDVRSEKSNDLETYVFGASDISSLGDLSSKYPKSVNVTPCVKLKELILGSQLEGYVNTNLLTVSVGSSPLLTKIDVSNSPNLKNLDVSKCLNISEIYAGGSGLTSLTLPDAGYITIMKLPKTLDSLALRNQMLLTNDNIILDDDDYSSITRLTVENCDGIDGTILLNKCQNVQYIRITGVNWRNCSYEFLHDLSRKNGISSAGGSTDYPFISGRCHIEELTGEQLASIRTWFPNLIVEYGKLSMRLQFKSEDGTASLCDPITRIITNGSTEEFETLSDPTTDGTINMIAMADHFVKSSTDKYHYTFGGWKLVPKVDEEPNKNALVGVVADTTFYVAFNKELRSYSVNFYVGEELNYTTTVKYGFLPTYPYDDPENPDTSDKDAYDFVGWYPVIDESTGIVKETNLYARFELNDSIVLVTDDFDWTVNSDGQTATINKYIGNNSVGRIPETLQVDDGKSYMVTSIGNYSDEKGSYGAFEESSNATNIFRVETILLPDGLVKLGSNAFAYCHNLKSIYITKNVSSIASDAFRGTSGVVSIAADPTNSIYHDDNNCLMSGTTVVLGCKNSIIPEGTTSIGKHAFYGCTELKSLELPSTITSIGGYSFTNCGVTSWDIPESVTNYGSMCFYGTRCSEIVLPKPALVGNQKMKLNDYIVGSSPSIKTVRILQDDPTKIEFSTGVFDNIVSPITVVVNWKYDADNTYGAPWASNSSTPVISVQYSCGTVVKYKNKEPIEIIASTTEG